MPKGKIEQGENQDAAAIREVMEETGIKGLSIEKDCMPTYHIYPFKNKLILKCTYWYRMRTADQSTLKPQLEEGITRAVWMNKKEIREAVNHSYASIISLLKTEELIAD